MVISFPFTKNVGPIVQAAPDTHFIKNDGRRFLSEWLKVAFVGTFNYASHLNIAVKTEEDGFSKPISLYFYSILPFFLLVTTTTLRGLVGLVISKLCHAK